MSSENPTVYSTEQGKICPSCDKPIKQRICHKQKSSSGDGNVRVSRETKGRKGKGVTLIKGLDMNSDALATMSKKLKVMCGSGGTVKSGFDKKDFLRNRGYKWFGGTEGRAKSWYLDEISKENLESELEYLEKEIYGRKKNLPVDNITAFNRFSGRF